MLEFWFIFWFKYNGTVNQIIIFTKWLIIKVSNWIQLEILNGKYDKQLIKKYIKGFFSEKFLQENKDYWKKWHQG